MADRYEYSKPFVTSEVGTGFVHLTPDDPVVDQKSGSKKWKFTAIDPKGANRAVLDAAVKEAAEKLWGNKAEQMLRHPKFKNPIKDGGSIVDREGKLYAGFEAGQTTWVMITSKAPNLVDRQVRPIVDTNGKTLVDEKTDRYEIVPANEIYSGVVVIAQGCAQAYDREDGFGVSFKLDNVQLVRGGKKLGGGGRMAAAQAFKPLAPIDENEFMD